MSQFGMQMPGGKGKRGSSLDVFTVLAFLSVVFLAVACGVMWFAASKVGKDGNAFELQEKGRISLSKRA
jgi:hypothetical protein